MPRHYDPETLPLLRFVSRYDGALTSEVAIYVYGHLNRRTRYRRLEEARRRGLVMVYGCRQLAPIQRRGSCPPSGHTHTFLTVNGRIELARLSRQTAG